MGNEIYVISGNEAKARRLCDLINGDAKDWDNTVIASVFAAKWEAAMPTDRIELIACALKRLTQCSLKTALDGLVQNGYLRSRKIAGIVHYELNY